jgi:hypothetical protein
MGKVDAIGLLCQQEPEPQLGRLTRRNIKRTKMMATIHADGAEIGRADPSHRKAADFAENLIPERVLRSAGFNFQLRIPPARGRSLSPFAITV